MTRGSPPPPSDRPASPPNLAGRSHTVGGRLGRDRFARAVLTCIATAAALLAVSPDRPGESRAGGASSAAGHAMHMVQVPAAAYLPLSSTLPREGWTATASDFENASGNGAPANVLDGDPATNWHSRWSGTPAELPHWITIDMGAAQTVSGLRYLPRQDGSSNGRIGEFSVRLSLDGTTWTAPVATGTWADDATVKTAAFATQGTRYVRLTAITEAGGRGPWSSAAEIDLLGVPDDIAPPPRIDVPRRGWTAVASDEEIATEADVASNAIDGDPYTNWSSRVSGTPAALPHSITLDMKRSWPVGGLTYLPRPDGTGGRIAQYEIRVSTDGTHFGTPLTAGTWSDDTDLKFATFRTTWARYVRLTAVTAADPSDPRVSAAEITVFRTPNPAAAGQWGPVLTFPIVPVSAVLLPGNRVLSFSAYSATAFGLGDGYTQTAILDLTTGTVSQRTVADTGHEMFCSGIALLPDGRVLVNGGSDSGKTSIYDPSTDVWTAGPTMNIPRGYEADTTLSNGRVFTLGGSWSGGEGGKNAEVFRPNGTWRVVKRVTAASILTKDPAGVYRSDNHGWFFAVADGGVFHAGPSRQMHWFTTAGAGSVTRAGPRGTSKDAMNGNAVMYDVGKILTDGGATAYQDVPASNRAYTIDISAGPTQPVSVQRVTNMAFARSFQNSVVLPDGKVVVVGGQDDPAPFSDRKAVMSPELWDPATGRFTLLATMAVPRTYHSVALLLPDGRVFSGGGGLCGTCATNHADAQIFTPPYLLRPDGSLRSRPVIRAAPAAAGYGTTITVRATAGLTSFALVRTGAVTHTVDTDQRRIPVTPTSITGGRYQLPIPADGGIAPPGNYLLFALTSAGTPSVASMISIR